MRVTLPLMAFSLLMVGCGVPRPDTNVCVVNAPAKNRKCYNLERDYEDDGTIKQGAKPQYRDNATIEALNKAVIIDPEVPANNQGLVNFKAWIQKIRDKAGQSTNAKIQEKMIDIIDQNILPALEAPDVSTQTL